jgi:hypothetical protein
MRPMLPLLPLLLACLAPSAAAAQGFTAELRAGAAVGEVTAALSGPQYQPGAAVFASAAWAPVPYVAGFVEYGQGQFGCRDGFCQGNDVRFTSRGAQAGVQLSLDPLWVRAGVVRRTLRSHWGTGAGRQQDDGGAGTGAEAGAGVAFHLPRALLPGVSLAPGVRYARHGGVMGAEGREGNVATITADLGIRWTRGGAAR